MLEKTRKNERFRNRKGRLQRGTPFSFILRGGIILWTHHKMGRTERLAPQPDRNGGMWE